MSDKEEYRRLYISNIPEKWVMDTWTSGVTSVSCFMSRVCVGIVGSRGEPREADEQLRWRLGSFEISKGLFYC